MPYYGVFDLLTLNVDNNGDVILAGSVLSDTLKKDAEREADGVPASADAAPVSADARSAVRI